ncbi:MAG: enoyl-CoA hydratase-related protein, partial [Acidobacteriota bacterium]
GADLGYMQRLAGQGEAESLEDARSLGRVFYRLADFPAPIVCAVQGAAIGGGLGLTVCVDYVLAEKTSVFATSEVRLGIVPGVISPYIVRKIGLANAGPLMLSGRRIQAPEARELGLVQEVVVPRELETSLQKAVAEFLYAGPHAARRTKALLKRARPLPDPELMDFTARSIAQARCSEEGRQGVDAFFAKAVPPWAAGVEGLE